MRAFILLVLFNSVLTFQTSQSISTVKPSLRKPVTLQTSEVSCVAPTIWQTASDLAVISTVCSAGIFVMIPFWYFGMQFSEAACRKIDDFFMLMKIRHVEQRIKKLDK